MPGVWQGVGQMHSVPDRKFANVSGRPTGMALIHSQTKADRLSIPMAQAKTRGRMSPLALKRLLQPDQLHAVQAPSFRDETSASAGKFGAFG